MKSLLLITAITLGTIFTTAHASTGLEPNSNFIVEHTVKTPIVNVFCTSIAKGDVDIVRKLISNGENVNQKSNGQTPAMYAAKYNRVEILNLLITNGANLKIKSDKGYTALDFATATNAEEAKQRIEQVLKK